MTQPNWNLVEIVKVDAKPQGFWNVAISFVPGPRLLRFRVVDKDSAGATVPTEWTVRNDAVPPVLCSGNGVGAGENRATYLCPAAPLGALIGKLGGSPIDIPDGTTAATPFGTKKVFPIGNYCVIPVAAADSGPLYLTINDELRGFEKHAGALYVEMHDATA
jgi:hypothetical protein